MFFLEGESPCDSRIALANFLFITHDTSSLTSVLASRDTCI